MKQKIKLDATLQLPVDGKIISIESLPPDLRYEIQTLDIIRQKAMDVALEHEILTLALKKKLEDIDADIKLLMIKQAPELKNE